MSNITNLPTLPNAKGEISSSVLLKIESEVIAKTADIDSLEYLEDWRLRAKGIEAYLRSPELQKPILSAQRHIEARIGQLLGPAGPQGKHSYHHDEMIQNSQDRSDFRILARGLNGECHLEFEEWRKSRRALVALIRERLNLLPDTPVLPAGKFCCIAADPPWQQDTGPEVFGGTGESGHDALTFKQMSVEQICNLKDKTGRPIQDCFADAAHLYLWTINKYVESSYTVARSWGFKPSVLLTWCKKPHGTGLGDTYRLTTEFCLFCRRGSLNHIKIIPTTWFEWPRGRHSEKPDAFYQMVEGVTPGPGRLELFARKTRPNWEVWGNEI